MKPSLMILVAFGVAVAVGTIHCLNHQTPAPAAARAVTTAPGVASAPPRLEPTSTPGRTALQPVPAATSETASNPNLNTRPEYPPVKGNTVFEETLEALLSPRTTFAQKHVLFEQLRQTGELEHAIAELKQRAEANPGDPQIATTLGEAQINQLRVLSEAGGDYNAIGILAMQADQSFNTALTADPSNWEAQFYKAAALSHWPPETGRDNEAIQRLSNLIDQQATMPSAPQFAQTYVVLGEEYQKLGQTDYAVQTWRLGAQNFPNDPTLKQKLAGP
jgi:tetratricopeptide (TPR) repeat protein